MIRDSKDEAEFYNALRASAASKAKESDFNEKPVERADIIGIRLGMNEKRIHFLLEKWADKGWWSYGVSARTGWFEPEAPAVFPA